MTTLQELLEKECPTEEEKEGLVKIVISSKGLCLDSKRLSLSVKKSKETIDGGRLDLSEYPSLEVVIIKSKNCLKSPLTSLNVSDCSHLIELDCQSNELKSLDLTNCATNLRELRCSDNLITNLDFSNCTNLEIIDCSSNQILGLNVNGLKELTSLDCHNNQIDTLNIQGCAKLRKLDHKNNPVFDDLDVNQNFVSFLDFANYSSLRKADLLNQEVIYKKKSELIKQIKGVIESLERNEWFKHPYVSATDNFRGKNRDWEVLIKGEEHINEVRSRCDNLLKELQESAVIALNDYKKGTSRKEDEISVSDRKWEELWKKSWDPRGELRQVTLGNIEEEVKRMSDLIAKTRMYEIIATTLDELSKIKELNELDREDLERIKKANDANGIIGQFKSAKERTINKVVDNLEEFWKSEKDERVEAKLKDLKLTGGSFNAHIEREGGFNKLAETTRDLVEKINQKREKIKTGSGLGSETPLSQDHFAVSPQNHLQKREIFIKTEQFLTAKKNFLDDRKETIRVLRDCYVRWQSLNKKNAKIGEIGGMISSLDNVMTFGIPRAGGKIIQSGVNFANLISVDVKDKEFRLSLDSEQGKLTELERYCVALDNLTENNQEGETSTNIRRIMEWKEEKNSFSHNYEIFDVLESELNIWRGRLLNPQDMEKITGSLNKNLNLLKKDLKTQIKNFENELNANSADAKHDINIRSLVDWVESKGKESLIAATVQPPKPCCNIL